MGSSAPDKTLGNHLTALGHDLAGDPRSNSLGEGRENQLLEILFVDAKRTPEIN